MARCGGHAPVVCALALVASACATEPIQPGVPREVTGQAIAPFEFHEECVTMVTGDRLSYRFEAQRPVDFSIRYHEGKAVIMPLSLENVTTDSGAFRALTAQDYCMMWEAGREGAILDYRVTLMRGPR